MYALPPSLDFNCAVILTRRSVWGASGARQLNEVVVSVYKDTEGHLEISFQQSEGKMQLL